jgi:HEAT repeat protein
MGLSNPRANNLISKDKEKSQKAAYHIINDPDIEAWKCLTENADYLFSFVLQKAAQKLSSEINKENVGKVFELLKYHAPVFDDYIAEGLVRVADEELNNEMIYLLQEGSLLEKAYAAKYVGKLRLEMASDLLFEASKQKDSYLKTVTAEALGELKDKKSYDFYLNLLNSSDDWERLESSQFLSLYGNKEASLSILKAMSSSGMAEHIAGEVANLIAVNELFYSAEEQEKALALEAFDNILSGITEVWSLAALFDFKVYECLESLVQLAYEDQKSSFCGKYAQLLLKARQKMSMFVENSQYTFDEEKDVKNELNEINSFLSSQNDDFWKNQAESVINELQSDDSKRLLAAIAVIAELNIGEALQPLIKIIYDFNNQDLIRCEAVLAVVKLGFIDKITEVKDVILSLEDVNIRAIVDNALS